MVVALAGILCCIAIVLFANAHETRASYNSIILATRTDFLGEYALARKQNAAWLQDAEDVALHFMGKERLRLAGEQAGRQSIERLPAPQDRANFIIVNKAFDDSVAAIKTRIDLIRHGAIWEIEWAGEQYQCRRGGLLLLLDGRWGWHTKPCP
jgi:hypothetical protein